MTAGSTFAPTQLRSSGSCSCGLRMASLLLPATSHPSPEGFVAIR
jgi:hypothetical protein